MQRFGVLLASVLAAWFGLLAILPAVAQDGVYATPEDAVAAYIDAVAHHDFKALIATTSVSETSSRFDFVAYVDRLQALVPSAPAPATDPFFIGVNRASFTAQIARQAQFLIYGLLAPSELVQGKTIRTDAAAAAAMVSGLDLGRLAGVTLTRVGAPHPTMLNSELNLRNMARIGAVYGADEVTDRVALLSFEGKDYLIGFNLMRFGDSWTINSQSSAIAGTDSLGAPAPTTPEAFDELLQ